LERQGIYYLPGPVLMPNRKYVIEVMN